MKVQINFNQVYDTTSTPEYRLLKVLKIVASCFWVFSTFLIFLQFSTSDARVSLYFLLTIFCFSKIRLRKVAVTYQNGDRRLKATETHSVKHHMTGHVQ